MEPAPDDTLSIARDLAAPLAERVQTSKSRAHRQRPSISRPLIFLLLLTYLFLVVYPIFWLFYTSLKTDREIFLNPFKLPVLRQIEWTRVTNLLPLYVPANFYNAWTKAHFETYFGNSVFLTISTVLVTTFLAAMTAYA